MEFRLKKLRKEKDISQLKLAIDLNMNQNTISRYENMERQADYETLLKFADYFDVSLDYLLSRTDNPKINKWKEVVSLKQLEKRMFFTEKYWTSAWFI